MTETTKARKTARAFLNQAAAHYEQGNFETALQLCSKGVDADPGFADGLHFQGMIQLARGEAGEAETLIRRALELDGNRMDFLQNLAVVLIERSALGEAIAVLYAVFEAEPDNTEALELLGSACFRTGEFAAAADAYARLIGLDPSNVRARHNFTLALREAPLTKYSAEKERFLVACLQLADIDYIHLTPSVVGQLLGKYAPADADGAEQADIDTLGSDPLVLNALPSVYLAGADLEDMFADVRRRLLETNNLNDATRQLVCGLGLYGLHTGFAWMVGEDERQRCGALQRELGVLSENDPTAPAAQDAALRLAMYGPLAEVAEVDNLCGVAPDAWPAPAQELVLRSLHLSSERHEIAASIEPLTGQGRADVRPPGLQWQSMPPRESVPFSEVLTARLPGFDGTAAPARRPLRVLVLEAGTGRHALNVAALYADATVLALDESADDLAYAKQKAREFELGNLQFALGGIGCLPELRSDFDVIEAPSGRITPADWKALRDTLDVGGILHVSTAMSLGREALNEAIRALGIDQADDDSVRSARRRILAGEAGDVGERLAHALEIYTLPGTRGLLTEMPGTSFAELWQAVEQGRFEFLGFSPIPARLAALYRSEFPDEPSGRRLENWVALEQREPERTAALLGYAQLGVWLRVLV